MSDLLLSYYKELEQRCLVPCKGNQDSLEVWISPHGSRISGTGFQSFSVGLGFWILIVSGIPEFFFFFFFCCISDSKDRISGSRSPLLGRDDSDGGEAKIATGASTLFVHLRGRRH